MCDFFGAGTTCEDRVGIFLCSVVSCDQTVTRKSSQTKGAHQVTIGRAVGGGGSLTEMGVNEKASREIPIERFDVRRLGEGRRQPHWRQNKRIDAIKFLGLFDRFDNSPEIQSQSQ